VSESETARVTTFVDVSPEAAFEVFTEEVDIWWRRGPRFRGGGPQSELSFELDQGGRRLVERERPSGACFEIGRVQVWEPGRRLLMSYRLRNFGPDDTTELEVRFEPFKQGTRVVLEHRGFASLRRDHPARHGLSGEALSSMIGLHWGDLLTSYRQRGSSSK
jgi:hypothetical protein